TPSLGFDGRLVKTTELLADVPDGGELLRVAYLGGGSRAGVSAHAPREPLERLALLTGALHVRSPRLIVSAFLVDDAEHLHEPRVRDVLKDLHISPAGQLVASQVVDAAPERVRVSGSCFIRVPARAKKARRS